MEITQKYCVLGFVTEGFIYENFNYLQIIAISHLALV